MEPILYWNGERYTAEPTRNLRAARPPPLPDPALGSRRFHFCGFPPGFRYHHHSEFRRVGQIVERRRLESWKEIASHLGRAVRTVQRWEKEADLPVYRLPGGGLERVFAYTDELDQWIHTAKPAGNGNGGRRRCIRRSPKIPTDIPGRHRRCRLGRPCIRTDRTDPTDPTDPAPPPGKVLLPWFAGLPRAWKLGLAAAALGLAVAGGFLFWRPAGQPAGAVLLRAGRGQPAVDSRTLAALDAAGSILWQRRFRRRWRSLPKCPSRLRSCAKPSCRTMDDLDGDGRREILVVTVSHPDGGGFLDPPRPGRRRQRALEIPARPCPGPWESARIDATWMIRYFMIDDLDGDGRREILVNARHSSQFPACLIVLDSAGRVVAEYPHGGPLIVLTTYDLDKDGWKEILASGDRTGAPPGLPHRPRQPPPPARRRTGAAILPGSGGHRPLRKGDRLSALPPALPRHGHAAGRGHPGRPHHRRNPDGGIRIRPSIALFRPRRADLHVQPPAGAAAGGDQQRLRQVLHRCLEEQHWLDHPYSDAEPDASATS